MPNMRRYESHVVIEFSQHVYIQQMLECVLIRKYKVNSNDQRQCWDQGQAFLALREATGEVSLD
ncbi:hypothetical protein [Desulfonatronum parangueonense]